jgi:hypothetical protein
MSVSVEEYPKNTPFVLCYVILLLLLYFLGENIYLMNLMLKPKNIWRI